MLLNESLSSVNTIPLSGVAKTCNNLHKDCTAFGSGTCIISLQFVFYPTPDSKMNEEIKKLLSFD